MTDEKEVEGSSARAADRGREIELGFSLDPRPSLGNLDVVRDLVSKFATDVVCVRKDYLEDTLTGDEAQDKIKGLAEEYGAIIMGRDKDYYSLPWNSPARLGRHIKLVIPPVEGFDDPGEQLFVTIGTSLSGIASAHESDRLSDKEAESATKTMLEDTVQLILGLR